MNRARTYASFAALSLAASTLLAAAPVYAAGSAPAPKTASAAAPGLWSVYENVLKHAKYIDLTHTITPSIPVWHGFGKSSFGPALNPATGKPYTWAKDGFELMSNLVYGVWS